jgi:hypothetical protein
MRRDARFIRWLAVLALAACKPPSQPAEPAHPDEGEEVHPDVGPGVEERRPGAQPRTEPAPSSAPASAPSCPGDPDCPATFEPLSLRDEDLVRIRRVQPIVRRAAAEHGLDPSLINARARGPAGARGMMQLMPRTSQSLAKKLGRRHRPYDPEFNIFAGTYYLARLVRTFDGDEELALAGYTRGAGRIKARVARGEPLPEGTQRFIHKILRAKATFAATFGSEA